jgi:hypothetical protein
MRAGAACPTEDHPVASTRIASGLNHIARDGNSLAQLFADVLLGDVMRLTHIYGWVSGPRLSILARRPVP